MHSQVSSLNDTHKHLSLFLHSHADNFFVHLLLGAQGVGITSHSQV